MLRWNKKVDSKQHTVDREKRRARLKPCDSNFNYMQNDKRLSLGEALYLLKNLYGRVWTILDAICTGALLISDTVLNQYYVKLCLTIERILEAQELLDLSKDYRRPFESLYSLQDADIEWEYDGSIFVSGFYGKIEELWILNGQKKCEDIEILNFLQEIDQYIEKYKIHKNKVENNYWAGVKEYAKDLKADGEQFKLTEFTKEKSPQQREILPDNQFLFIREDSLRSKIQRDYEELRKVYEVGASKSMMVLSGCILEALLIDFLSIDEDKSKFDYFQKYLEGKDKGQNPPNIEDWKLYQLIEIAAQRGIISTDVKRIGHTIMDYRNLIHLRAEIRDKLSVDKNVATSVLHLLLKAIDDISKWFGERNF